MLRKFEAFFLLFLSVVCFASNDKLLEVESLIEKQSVDILNFGFLGVEQSDLFGDPIPRRWYVQPARPNAKDYNFHIGRKVSIKDSAEGQGDRLSIVTLGNNSDDVTLAVVARFVSSYGSHEERFLIKLEPDEEIHLNFLSLPDGEIELYCMAPFQWSLTNKWTGERTSAELIQPFLRQPIAESTQPNPSNACEGTRFDQRLFCTHHRITNPHCIRVVGEFNGGVALASMHWFFECPQGPDDPMFQYVQVFYPTREDLFHKSLGWAVPPCNPDPDPGPQGRDDYLDNNNYSFTENVLDPTKKHRWNSVYRVAWDGTQERVDCVGTFSCVGGFLYQKHFTCE